jgi:hypothetical protein
MASFVSGRFTFLGAMALSLLMIAGCSHGLTIPRTVPVSGKIIYREQPLAGADVGFVSRLDNRDVLSARGVTDAAGEFTLSTYIDPQHEVSGATPGEFVVTVSKVEKIDQKLVMEQFSKDNPSMEGMMKKLVPPKYSEVLQSPLKASVTAGATNRFEFKLED